MLFPNPKGDRDCLTSFKPSSNSWLLGSYIKPSSYALAASSLRPKNDKAVPFLEYPWGNKKGSYKTHVGNEITASTTTHFGPVRFYFNGLLGIFQRFQVFRSFRVSGRPVTVEHVIFGIQRDGRGVRFNGQLVLSGCEGGVTLFLQTQRRLKNHDTMMKTFEPRTTTCFEWAAITLSFPKHVFVAGTRHGRVRQKYTKHRRLGSESDNDDYHGSKAGVRHSVDPITRCETDACDEKCVRCGLTCAIVSKKTDVQRRVAGQMKRRFNSQKRCRIIGVEEHSRNAVKKKLTTGQCGQPAAPLDNNFRGWRRFINFIVQTRCAAEIEKDRLPISF